MKFTFFDENPQFDIEKDFVAILPKNIEGKSALLNELKKTLQFPEYFGENWDALLDCLSDFHWTNKKNIQLIHLDIPKLPISELKVYIDILNIALNDWGNVDDIHKIHVYFPRTAEHLISRLL